jgi:hypothetical protein
MDGSKMTSLQICVGTLRSLDEMVTVDARWDSSLRKSGTHELQPLLGVSIRASLELP